MSVKILVIEDNSANLQLMVYLLQAFGYVPRTATNGAAGLEIAGSERFDLIICDVQMPGLDGYDVVRELRRFPPDQQCPVVAVTALAMVGDREKLLAVGFDGYLSKPIDPESFVGEVGQFLRPPDGSSSGGSSHHPDDPGARRVRRILVVDNQPVNHALARGILIPSGYEVVEATSIGEALAKAQSGPIDLILSDVCLSGETGFEFLSKVKAEPSLQHIPFMFLTSTMCDERTRSRGIAAGADRFLFRPIEPEDLLREIEECISEFDGAE